MKDRSPRAFTLVEMIVVIAVLIVLAGLIVAGASIAYRNGSRNRAITAMKDMENALSGYKQDNGTFPQTASTDQLDPRQHFNSASGPDALLYQKASRDLYIALSGDTALTGRPPVAGRSYWNFSATRDLAIQDGTIRFIKDPFGNPYGYSTIAALAEAEYQEQLRSDPSAARPPQKAGYDPNFDLWSTAGGTTATQQPKWIKKWGQ